jgi:hypothetical protein
MKEISNDHTDIIVSDSSQTPSHESEFESSLEIQESGKNKHTSINLNVKSLLDDILQKSNSLKDNLEISIEYIDEKDKINNQIDDVYLKARQRSASK